LEPLVTAAESAQQGGVAERKAMIDRMHDLPSSKQAEALNISRGSVYYLPRPVPQTKLAICTGLIGCTWSIHSRI
jgi:putative transposase